MAMVVVRWHEISKMAAARAAPARDAETNTPRLPPLLGRRENPDAIVPTLR